MQNANKSLQSLLFLNASSLIGKKVELSDGTVEPVESVTNERRASNFGGRR
jgi:flagellar hook assembly protein FlgD